MSVFVATCEVQQLWITPRSVCSEPQCSTCITVSQTVCSEHKTALKPEVREHSLCNEKEAESVPDDADDDEAATYQVVRLLEILRFRRGLGEGGDEEKVKH